MPCPAASLDCPYSSASEAVAVLVEAMPASDVEGAEILVAEVAAGQHLAFPSVQASPTDYQRPFVVELVPAAVETAVVAAAAVAVAESAPGLVVEFGAAYL